MKKLHLSNDTVEKKIEKKSNIQQSSWVWEFVVYVEMFLLGKCLFLTQKLSLHYLCGIWHVGAVSCWPDSCLLLHGKRLTGKCSYINEPPNHLRS